MAQKRKQCPSTAQLLEIYSTQCDSDNKLFFEVCSRKFGWNYAQFYNITDRMYKDLRGGIHV